MGGGESDNTITTIMIKETKNNVIRALATEVYFIDSKVIDVIFIYPRKEPMIMIVLFCCLIFSMNTNNKRFVSFKNLS